MNLSLKKIRILYLEDNPMDVELSIHTLEKFGYELDCKVVQTKKEYLSALEKHEFDLILADYNLPTFDGMSALLLYNKLNLDIPFILVSGTVGEELAIESLKAGAIDYVLKNSLTRLGMVVERSLRETEERRQNLRVELALQKNEQDLKFLIDNTLDVIWQMDLKLNFTYVSPSIYAQSGFTQEEWLGTNLSDHASRKEFLMMGKQIFEALKNYKTFKQVHLEVIIYRKDKTEWPVEIVGKLMLNDKGIPYGLQGTTRDITGRYEAQQQLHNSEERFRIMYNNSPDFNVTINPDSGEILLCNEALLNETGYTREELMGTSISNLYLHDTDQEETGIFDRFKKTGRLRDEECVLIRQNGSKISVSLNADAVQNDEGNIEYAIFSWRDITERLELQQQAQHFLDHQIATNELSLGLGETDELSEIYLIIYNHIRKLMDVSSFAISVYHQPDEVIQVKFAITEGNIVEVSAIPVFPVLPKGIGQQNRVILTGKPIYLPNYHQTLGDSTIDKTVGRHRKKTRLSLGQDRVIKSALYAPMKSQGQTVGVMQVQSYRLDAYTQHDIDLFCSLANVASISIQNANLVQNLALANQNIAEAYDSTLEGWAKALELRDMETEGHSRRVVDLTMRLAKKMGVKDEEMVHIYRGALLHDIGKMSIPDSILQKPGKLNEEEWKIMRQHPVYANHWLSSIKYLEPCLDIPRYHHEKWDGSGYPNGLQGEQIPLAARIFAIVDVWDALLSDRPYREAWSRDRAIDYIAFHAEQHFDPDIVKVFLRLVAVEKLEIE